MPRKSYQPIELEQEVKRLAMGEYSPSQIYKHLEAQGCFKPMPTLRTIQRMVKEIAPPDLSGEWSLVDAEPEDARLILDTFAEAAAHTAGRSFISKGTADWVVRVRRAAPTLPPYDAFVVAREYRRATDTRDSKHIRALDALLAFKPWESVEAADRYEALLSAGIFGQPIYLGQWWRDITTRHGQALSAEAVAKNIQNFAELEEWMKPKEGAGQP